MISNKMNPEISNADVSLLRFGECILLPEANFPHSMTMQSDSDMSYMWNFCVLVSFCGETSGDIVKCQLFSQTDRTHFKKISSYSLLCSLIYSEG